MSNSSKGRSRLWDIRNDQEVIPYVLFVMTLIAFNFILMHRHETWRDEAQAWLMAKELNPLSLLNELSYEGHPCLWFLVLMPFAKAGLPVIFLNLISTVIMTAVMLLIAVCAPFDRISKILLMSSPLCIYAYSTISRSYCLIALLLVLLAMCDGSRYEHPVRYAVLIALLIQTHIVMIGMCFALCACHFFGTVYGYFQRKNAGEGDAGSFFAANAVSLVIPLLSAVFLLYEFRDVKNAASANVGGTMALPELLAGMISSAKSCLVFLYSDFRYAAVIAAALFAAAALICDIRIFRGLIVCAITVVCQLYIYAKVWGLSNYRHVLLLWLLFWFLWIARNGLDEKADSIFYNPSIILLSLAIIASSTAATWAIIEDIKADYNGLYSDAGGAAAAIEALPEDAVIFEGSGEFCNSVIARLRTKKVYSPFYEQEAGFCIRNTARFRNLNYSAFEETAKKMFPGISGAYVLFSDTSGEGYMGNIEGFPEKYDEIYTTQVETIRDEGYRIIYIPFEWR